MARRRPSIGNRPFAFLGHLLAEKAIQLPEVCLPKTPNRRLTPAEEKDLFLKATADVIPLTGLKTIAPRRPRPRSGAATQEDPDAEALHKLKQLVERGEGFVLRHTAEYVEGAAGWMPPEIFRRIHGGHFSIQDHVDLHGLNLSAAQAHFDRFMERAIACGWRAVLVVHGRGRRSPGPPVLKAKLFEWLTRGPWKRWVIAFTSARACDGGTGATYVLLKRRPR